MYNQGLKVDQALENNTSAGLFVGGVLAGGAAEESGQIRPNDRIICINDAAIIGLHPDM